MMFADAACDLAPFWLLPGGLLLIALLLAALIAVVLWPLGGRIRVDHSFDAMAAPFGDQPRMPS